jgi:hypothetical protein
MIRVVANLPMRRLDFGASAQQRGHRNLACFQLKMHDIIIVMFCSSRLLPILTINPIRHSTSNFQPHLCIFYQVPNPTNMEIIRLNNLAASLVFSGKHEEALGHLQRALSALRDVVNQASNLEIGSCHHNIARAVEESHRSHRSKVSPLIIASVQDDRGTQEASVESAFQFYDKVFRVSPNQISRCCCSSQLEKLQHLLLAVISKSFQSSSWSKT